ncbi:hypothetical protein DICPUDRAFT_38642 [Dictyostelium purpureum]|uniref:DUF6314 domain-containing protein n=1 Tax=Dictyostelium purpureum TaxID=5786 RepID=F0ZUW4_DICPU|nr:uncharacterized protein DICPUDRAFT_38642 [Dictyostelium purpureum]EGC32267.1 hypothetical protein DICPUDRAFT_38642 [Dictyostelium purpureum]|eukprot:XP_003291204.1 hypothetical protein DICPUDRAFT_38642 [Dictyostelium purpureum]
MFKIFQSLSGKWSFHRNIIHKLTTPSNASPFSNLSFLNNNNNNLEQPPIIVTGLSNFELKKDEENTYQYSEEGIMKNPDGTEFNISQKYIYKYKDEIISVFFDEKPERLLHTLNFDQNSSSGSISSNNTAKGHHLCGCDTYDAVYQFISPREFKLVYSVEGPKKNYKIITTFSKLSL